MGGAPDRGAPDPVVFGWKPRVLALIVPLVVPPAMALVLAIVVVILVGAC